VSERSFPKKHKKREQREGGKGIFFSAPSPRAFRTKKTAKHRDWPEPSNCSQQTYDQLPEMETTLALPVNTAKREKKEYKAIGERNFLWRAPYART
jgi:hypothetical protein